MILENYTEWNGKIATVHLTNQPSLKKKRGNFALKLFYHLRIQIVETRYMLWDKYRKLVSLVSLADIIKVA